MPVAMDRCGGGLCKPVPHLGRLRRRIEGVADRELLVQDNPQDPRNRRISILLMP